VVFKAYNKYLRVSLESRLASVLYYQFTFWTIMKTTLKPLQFRVLIC